MLSIVSWAAVYFVIWWTTLFVVLPFGARGRREEAEPVSGADRGAPARAPMRKLFLVTTLIATILFVAFYIILTRQLIGLDDIPLLPKFEQIR